MIISLALQGSGADQCVAIVSRMPTTSLMLTTTTTMVERFSSVKSAIAITGTQIATQASSQAAVTVLSQSESGITNPSPIPTVTFSDELQPRTSEDMSQTEILDSTTVSPMISMTKRTTVGIPLTEPPSKITAVPSNMSASPVSSVEQKTSTITVFPMPSLQPLTRCISVNTTDPRFPSLGKLIMFNIILNIS